MSPSRKVQFELAVSEGQPSPRRSGNSTRKMTAYDAVFEQHLNDHGIHTQTHGPKPANIDQLKRMLVRRRSSLTRVNFTDSNFEEFQIRNEQAGTEAQVVNTVLPLVIGGEGIQSHQGVLFSNLAPLTDGSLFAPIPGLYDGCNLADLDKSVRDQLDSHVVPSRDDLTPILHNFFLETQGPEGNIHANKLQACYEAALGARAMHSLRNYANPDTALDGNAYTISATFYGGLGEDLLTLYATHPVASEEDGRSFDYCRTKLKSYSMTDDVETFRRGAAALRNAREWAQEQRALVVTAANLASRERS